MVVVGIMELLYWWNGEVTVSKNIDNISTLLYYLYAIYIPTRLW